MPEIKLCRINMPDESAAALLTAVLYESMHSTYPCSFPDAEAAAREVRMLDQEDRFAIVAEQGSRILGWIGTVMHDHLLWELHPLCVLPEFHRTGLGRMLVSELEHVAREDGARALWLGTEDEIGATTLFETDLWPDPLAHLQKLKLVRDHPIAFYQRLGYALCGVIPDASGPGRHDFIMAKRLQ